MKSDYTDITIVVDRSASMQSCCKSAEDGINELIASQKLKPGTATVTIIEFDDISETVCSGTALHHAPKYKLKPRGMTALYDAVGTAINATGERLAALPESERPGLVLFLIATDGGENASKRFKAEQVKEMTERQQAVYNWQFIYVGANQDAFRTAASFGVSASNAASYSTNKMGEMYGALDAKVGVMRACSAAGDMEGVAHNAKFSAEERQTIS